MPARRSTRGRQVATGAGDQVHGVLRTRQFSRAVSALSLRQASRNRGSNRSQFALHAQRVATARRLLRDVLVARRFVTSHCTLEVAVLLARQEARLVERRQTLLGHLE